jgi:hypothetical protein
MEAPVPSQVADRLRGRRFTSFDDFRHALWKASADVPALATQFSVANRALMSRGESPKAPPAQQTAESTIFHLHHLKSPAEGGRTYDVDNIRVVSPLRYHQKRHYGGLPVDRGSWAVDSTELREKLTATIDRLMSADGLNATDQDRLIDEFENNVFYPYAADLIFHWRHEFKDVPEIVEFALGQTKPNALSRDELVDVARRLMTGEVANAVQSERLSRQFKSSVPHPEGDGLIFYPKTEFRDPAELVDYALTRR